VKIAALHYRGFLTDRGLGTASSDQSAPLDQNEIMAIYVDATNTIYLPEGWTGQTPMELSVLVHEMVHHLQSIAGLRYECRQAREKLAFLAQDRWLDLFGQSLGSAFGIDPFTLLVRTRCM
jgi:hypothetical protein